MVSRVDLVDVAIRRQLDLQKQRQIRRLGIRQWRGGIDFVGCYREGYAMTSVTVLDFHSQKCRLRIDDRRLARGQTHRPQPIKSHHRKTTDRVALPTHKEGLMLDDRSTLYTSLVPMSQPVVQEDWHGGNMTYESQTGIFLHVDSKAAFP